MRDILIYSIGFGAQLMFTSRTFIQWIASEKQRKVVNPTIFWQLSLLGACLMIVYGIMRKDAPIIFGQVLTYGIYVRNIQLKNKWDSIPRFSKLLIWGIPIAGILFLIFNYEQFIDQIVINEDIPFATSILGFGAQVLFTSRFVYQWIYSEKRGFSHLPAAFWMISIAGSSLILWYGILRVDPVLILGHCTGLIVYIRNLYLGYN